ncbi:MULTISPECIES: Rieske 2Fe-2S domain-containing protein [unclassified Beijerinckia]|uniref:Rieske 2Fe-2S domain-containing protein n=1 Tax=unclassified Beijerinckia TaxID=2638183 RepID=UPI00089CF830|nr:MULTISPECIES: Rieske 2Fe-2S domain-containing protein [unclassified Beijerinckia]MDH7796078.1 phthalate 4,5-dioxygenase oxygenase subunit [Beijerinckia sp. GAS462]SEC29302.1 phthalate 4,5-dioxygenase, oxygenase subunit [Beijerinckia sp. 28-YEA-48]
MLTQDENDLLCRVEGDAPMGHIMRQHWLPACMIEEVAEPDCDPLKVRLCGEDYVVFRDTNGQVGMLDEQCPHRRASLAFGRNEDCGLRCLYHGWKFDVNGNAMEMNSEPVETGLLKKMKTRAYPVREAAGFVWCYLGPVESMPEFEPPVCQPTPDTRISIAKYKVPVNWAQILEGAIDSSHSSTLHSSDMVPARVAGAQANEQLWLRPSTDKSPRLYSQRTPFGFRYAAVRRPIQNAQTHDYIRTTLFVAPYTVLIPPNNNYKVVIMHVPIDDENTDFYFLAFGDNATTPGTEEWRKFLHAQVGIDVDESYRSYRTFENNFKQDRQAMKLGNFTGIPGIPNQDYVMWLTMGKITDRTREILGQSDLAIVEFRRQMVEAAQSYQTDGTVIGRTAPHIPLNKLRSFEGVAPKTTDWRVAGLDQEELDLRGLAVPTTTAAE